MEYITRDELTLDGKLRINEQGFAFVDVKAYGTETSFYLYCEECGDHLIVEGNSIPFCKECSK